MKFSRVWVFLLMMMLGASSSFAEADRILSEGRIHYYHSHGNVVKVVQDRYCYTIDADNTLLATIARQKAVLEAMSATDGASSKVIEILKSEVDFHKGVIVQRDLWLAQEKRIPRLTVSSFKTYCNPIKLCSAGSLISHG